MTSAQPKKGGQLVLAIDPGREKCGIALVHEDGFVLILQVVPTSEAPGVIRQIQETHKVRWTVMGSGTTSRQMALQMKEQSAWTEVVLVDESHTTLEARKLYFQDHPPKGWRRLIPLSMLTPEREYDDYAALVLAKRFLASVRT